VPYTEFPSLQTILCNQYKEISGKFRISLHKTVLAHGPNYNKNNKYYKTINAPSWIHFFATAFYLNHNKAFDQARIEQ
jgi:hypothetical protein